MIIFVRNTNNLIEAHWCCHPLGNEWIVSLCQMPCFAHVIYVVNMTSKLAHKPNRNKKNSFFFFENRKKNHRKNIKNPIKIIMPIKLKHDPSISVNTHVISQSSWLFEHHLHTKVNEKWWTTTKNQKFEKKKLFLQFRTK